MSDPDFCHDLFIFKMCVKSFSLKLRYRAKLSLTSLPENEFIVFFFFLSDWQFTMPRSNGPNK